MYIVTIENDSSNAVNMSSTSSDNNLPNFDYKRSEKHYNKINIIRKETLINLRKHKSVISRTLLLCFYK